MVFLLDMSDDGLVLVGGCYKIQSTTPIAPAALQIYDLEHTQFFLCWSKQESTL
jgi:hypothetical protein